MPKDYVHRASKVQYCCLCNRRIKANEKPKKFLSNSISRVTKAKPVEAECFEVGVRSTLMFEMLYTSYLPKRRVAEQSRSTQHGYKGNVQTWPEWNELEPALLSESSLCDRCSCCLENQAKRFTIDWSLLTIGKLHHVVNSNFLELCDGTEEWKLEDGSLCFEGMCISFVEGRVQLSVYRKTRFAEVASIGLAHETLLHFLKRV